LSGPDLAHLVRTSGLVVGVEGVAEVVGYGVGLRDLVAIHGSFPLSGRLAAAVVKGCPWP